jgi:hypothetical protein
MSAEELSNASCSTPTKSRQPPIEDDPLTPTTNLKVLLSAISPALRDRESKRRKGLIFSDDVNEGEKKPTDSDDQIEKAKNKQKRPEYSRKDKSLAKLCSRFLDLFDKEDNVGKTIYLDNAAKQLGVERRRVYDIVNVLESLEIAKREAKNQYLWKGRSQLPATVTKLRAHAHQKGLMPKLDLQQSEELSVETIRENIQKLPGKSANVSDSENEEVGKDVEDKEPQKKYRSLLERRDRSLGCLTQRFLMLFFVSDTKIVGLDVAALILIGNMSPESAKWKTKVRRLYDIANILSSLQLIKKVRLPLRYGMKPAYQWVGTELDTAAQQYVAAERLPTTCKAPAKKRSYSKKHTLLDSFEAIPLPKLDTTDDLSNSQGSANLDGSSQPEVSTSNADTNMSTELQMASALMQLKTGQPVVPITSQSKPMTSSISVTNPSQSQIVPSHSSKPAVFTVMQTSFLPSGQCLLVPKAANSSSQRSVSTTAVILPSTSGKTEENVVPAQPKPVLFSFLPSTQFQQGTTFSAIPVLKVAMPVSSSQIKPPSQSQLPTLLNTSPTTGGLPQPFTIIPSPSVSPTPQTTLSNPHFIASKPNPRPIAPKGNPPTSTDNVQAQLDVIRELLAHDGEAYQKLIEKQQLYGTQTTALQASRPSPSLTGIAGFALSNLHTVPIVSSPTARSPPMVQMSSSEQKIEQLHREILRQHTCESSPPSKPLRFHQYTTPQKHIKEQLQSYSCSPQRQSIGTPMKSPDISEGDTSCHLIMSPNSSSSPAAQLECSEELSPSTSWSSSLTSSRGLDLGSALHAKRWQQARQFTSSATRRTSSSKEIPQKTVAALAQTNLSRLPVFQDGEQCSSKLHEPVLTVPVTQAFHSRCISSFPVSCSGKCLSTFKPLVSLTNQYFTHESGSADESWNFSKQREP